MSQLWIVSALIRFVVVVGMILVIVRTVPAILIAVVLNARVILVTLMIPARHRRPVIAPALTCALTVRHRIRAGFVLLGRGHRIGVPVLARLVINLAVLVRNFLLRMETVLVLMNAVMTRIALRVLTAQVQFW